MNHVIAGIRGISGYWFRVRNWFPNVQHRGIGCILQLKWNIEANVSPNRQPSMDGEDFAFMLLERPGAFIFLGINDDETKPRHLHSPNYNFNDKAIPFGVDYWINLV